MTEYILRTNALTKKYKNDYALKNVDVTIKRGEIYGLIGQNGAGKTTMLRLITGLAFPTNGSIELFENNDRREMTAAHKRMGAIIENPALFPNMTAYENLEVQRLQRGIPGRECIEKALKLVGLEGTGKKKVKNFSLGMKQRLGLAIALLSDPEFIILDEPTNGLDPMGIVEMRELLKKLNREKGLTVLISSHILSELYQLATKFGIIHQGQLLEEISAGELNDKCRQYLRIKVDEPAKGVNVLEEKLSAHDFEILSDGTIKLYSYLDDVHLVSRTLTEHGLVIEHLSQNGDSLENYFTKLIGGVENE
ncbi:MULTISPECIES: ABC transporter ATP-binding protein [Bacillaceae]|uniref:Bacitracin ABC transporter ATP-binding protein n=2 Tax=Bacillaceae TaxID=186817 RepID=A0A511V0L6_9BACI|nr:MULTISPECIES: ATP-binding cassette domain-containing protein [Bacillaceae]MBB5147568.1 ABC-2 type transport system ATP-binding protein [Cerasibacillus quisquiliarum]BAM46610.1 putative ABC transporter ATP-binding protein [Amphibacillus xylanus NBRC 15112]GEN32454.1 bacitracin ABC transporter ATP-binding protein [Cerasibacillus quisquiliarum]